MGSRPKDEWFGFEPDDGDTAAGEVDAAATPAGEPPGAPSGESELTDAELTDAELADAERIITEALGDNPDVFASPGIGVAALAAERDEYREALLRVKADFDNYKKRVAANQAATVERAAEKLVSDLLPVLDACEAALGHGATDVEPIFKSLVDVLERGGLARIDAEGAIFDPNLHEAVMHEPADDDTPETVVSGALRTGYQWNGRVIRPAMVKVKG